MYIYENLSFKTAKEIAEYLLLSGDVDEDFLIWLNDNFIPSDIYVKIEEDSNYYHDMFIDYLTYRFEELRNGEEAFFVRYIKD